MFFSTVPDLNFDMCIISTRIKTIYPLDITNNHMEGKITEMWLANEEGIFS